MPNLSDIPLENDLFQFDTLMTKKFNKT